MKNKKVAVQNWGLIDYKEAWDKQQAIFDDIVKQKMSLREKAIDTGNEYIEDSLTPNYLIFCQHPHVYTLGNSGHPENLLLDDVSLKEKDATYYRINRGGDITYHGP